MPSETPTTQVADEPALRQFRSADGHKIVSIVVAAGQSFRFVEDTEMHEPATPFMEAHWYWEETHRSGVYSTADEAEHEAMTTLPWLRSLVSR
jgi:hypothetical protein